MVNPRVAPGVCVYLSGPITAARGYIIEENVIAGMRVFLECLQRGIPAFCPHLVAAFPSNATIEYETWIAYGCAMIDRCTAILMLSRWQESPGAIRERAYAVAIGLPVYYDLGALQSAIAAAAAEKGNGE